MQGSLSVTHVTNYKIKTEYVYFSSLTCTRMHLRAPIFQNFPGGACPQTPLLLHTQKSHFFFFSPPYFKILYQSLLCVHFFPRFHSLSLFRCVQYEAIPESLKNMLLVMATQGVFDLAAINTGQSDRSSGSHAQELWELTWNRIEEFLPHFLKALFPNVTPPVAKTTASHDLPPGSHDPSNIDEASESTSPDSPTQESTNQIRGSPPLSSSPETGTDMFPITLHPPLPSLTPSPLTPSQHGGTPGNVSPSGHMTSSGSHDHSAGEGDTDHMTESVRSHDGEIARQHISVVMETNGETLLSARDRTVVGMEPSIALGSVPEPRTAPVLIQQPTFSGNHGDAANRIAIPVTTTVFNL